MSQILAGVHTQMVNMKEEEILVKIGEKTLSCQARESSHGTPRSDDEGRGGSLRSSGG